MSERKYNLLPCQSYAGFSLPEGFETVKDKIAKFKVEDSDIFVTSFPKSGTTWCQEMVWLLANNLDYEKAKTDLTVRYPVLEMDGLVKAIVKFNQEIKKSKLYEIFGNAPSHLKILENTTGPRFISSHLPWSFLPEQILTGQKKPKIVHIMRDPKEVLISFYYYVTEIVPIDKGDLNDFIDLYISGKVPYGPYFMTVPSYWKQRNLSNVLIVTFEDMYNDLKGVIRKVASFLGKSYSDDLIEKLTHHLNFDQMKNNDAVNRQILLKNDKLKFMRSGRVDSYKDTLTPEMIYKLNEWIMENVKDITGFPYGID